MDDRYRKALDAALADVTADPEVIGVLFTGSVQQGCPDRTSDLDLYVVTHKEYYWRATRFYEGVETELFFNNVASMRWRITRPDEVAATAGFATGEILLDRTGEMSTLHQIARQRWEAGPPAPTDEQITAHRYHLNDLCEDLEDVANDPVASRVTGGAVVGMACQIYCTLHRLWATKPKRMVSYLREHDERLGSLVDSYYSTGMEPDQAIAVADYVLAPVGGRLVLWESQRVNYREG